MIYGYFERDYFNNDGSLPMTRAHYAVLLACCFRNASYFSLVAKSDPSPILQELSPWETAAPRIGTSQEDALSYFQVCDQTFVILSSRVQSLFDFDACLNHLYPEDLTFYRSDGSVFMDSIAHEGECTLYIQPGEDIADVLAFGNWLPLDENGRPRVPAASIDLRLPAGTDIAGDHLYIQLRALQENPCDFIGEETIEALQQWIRNDWAVHYGGRLNLPDCINVLPCWYVDFEFYILQKCNALTTDSVIDAMRSVGWSGKTGFDKFFSLLAEFC